MVAVLAMELLCSEMTRLLSFFATSNVELVVLVIGNLVFYLLHTIVLIDEKLSCIVLLLSNSFF